MNTESFQSMKTLQKEITNQIIQQLEAGVMPWHCPWALPTPDNRLLSYNFCSDEAYKGINLLILWNQRMKKRYITNGWVTFRQAHDQGGHVMEGERGVRCFYYNFQEVVEEVDGKEKKVKKPFFKSYTLFNVDQVQGGNFALPSVEQKFDSNEQAEKLVKATNAIIEERKIRATYYYGADRIALPPKSAFSKAEDYYATLFHELVHWTGHETRLKRDIFSLYQKEEAYAFEELVAEIGSAFLCADMGLLGQGDSHASYIASWIKLLKEHDNAIIKAASFASRAHQYLLNLPKKTEELPQVDPCSRTAQPVSVASMCRKTLSQQDKSQVEC